MRLNESVMIVAVAAGPNAARGAETMEARLDSNTQAADAVVVATLVGLGTPPGFWSGRALAYQGATWALQRSLKAPGTGPLAGTLQVKHLVVAGSPTAASGAPGLSTDFFVVGHSYILFLRLRDDGLQSLNEKDAVLPADDALIARLSLLLANP